MKSILCLLLLGATTMAGELSQSGHGSVSGQPDTGNITVGVITRDLASQKAMADNATTVAKVRATLKAAGFADEDVKTVQFGIDEEHKQIERKRGQETTHEVVRSGFRVTHMLDIKVKDLTKFGSTLDALNESGATSIQNVAFSSSKASEYLDEARQGAVKDAQHKAQLVADALGYKLGEVKSVAEESRGRPSPVYRSMSMAMDAPGGSRPTELSGGSLEFAVDIHVIWLLEKK